MRSIDEVATDLGIHTDDLVPVGRHAAKIEHAALSRPASGKGRLVLVSAVTPTKAGEGKTTVSVALTMGLRARGRSVCLALREPSLGPVFGIKGGGTGGGAAQVVPSDEINLHFTGDMHAIGAAHNLLAALVDTDLHFGAPSGLDSRRVRWPRVLDVNDRALRNITTGLGGRDGGVPRETRFDITAASEVMAVLSLAEDLPDLERRLARIVVGQRADLSYVTAADLEAAPAMAALLRDALLPNLVQTAAGDPALVHGGPFANIAHGCSSVAATRIGLHYSDLVVTEAGFGFDLGGEKFLDIKCRQAGLWPRCVVLVTTVKALEAHGEGDLARGLGHLDRQLANVRRFGLTPVVAVNVFGTDEEVKLKRVEAHADRRGAKAARVTSFVDGAAGGEALADVVWEACAMDEPDKAPHFLYALQESYGDKVHNIAQRIYGARDVAFTATAKRALARLDECAPGLPVCVAKTHLSFSDDPKAGGLAEGFVATVREVRPMLGAGFVTVLMGEIVTMPALPREPAAKRVRIDADGKIRGLMQGD